ncbi:sensor histidine kinase [Xanthovirga aplysinae]|uniref:sensor histidine kinase n=1 Tax=Xanthovirga aplysinae TaxID=2529853 RepID=UPI0012BC920C|nr:two-component regulator propeller domain-containing protein [Xanthovirga aplysinae]MTI33341.1 GAF domain-containing protein [Xanthovirga aplysinae]
MLKRTAATLLLLLLTLSCFCQQHNFKSYSLEEGLPQSQVSAFIQDSRGHLWIGTNGGGLSKFNGQEFKTYTQKDGLSGNIIFDLMEDSKGNLWITTENGINSYDGRDFLQVAPNIRADFLGNLWEDKSGNIWIHKAHEKTKNSSQIIVLDKKGNIKNFAEQYPEINKNNEFRGYFTRNNSIVYIATEKGYFEFDGTELKPSPINYYPEVKKFLLYPIFEDKENRLWLVSYKKPNTIYTLHKNELREFNLPQMKVPFRVNNIIQDNNEHYWISIEGIGVYKWDGQNFHLFNEKNGLSSNMVNGILEVHEGNIWFSTNGAGIIKYNIDHFIAYQAKDGLPSEMIRAIFQDSKGHYWFGTTIGEVIEYDGEKMVTRIPQKQRIGLVRKFIELENGNLLIATMGGLWEYKGKNFSKVNQKYGLIRNTGVNDMIREGNQFLFATNRQGIVLYDKEKTKTISQKGDSLLPNNIRTLYKDSKGNLWGAVYLRGLLNYRFQPWIKEKSPEDLGDWKIKKYDEAHGLKNDIVLQITEDDYNQIWFATYGGGITLFDGKTFKHITSEDGLTSDNIYSILKDKEGNLWAGTQNGVDKITLDSLGQVTNITNYGVEDGFIGIENNGMANLKDQEGNLWFGTIKGAMKYIPRKKEANLIPPMLHFKNLKLFYKDIDWTSEGKRQYHSGFQNWSNLPQNLKLPYDLNHLSFEFEALSYRAPEKINFQWKLEGLDQDWSPVSDKNEVVYSNLPAGNYTLLIKAANNDGVWTKEPITYHFSISQPWWAQWWFKASILLLLLTIIYGIVRLRINNIESKKKELEFLVKEKTSEVVRQKNEILVKSKQLEEANHTLETLSEIGKEITTCLSVEKIIYTIYENVNNLMDGSSFAIGIHDKESNSINFHGAIENGTRLKDFSFQLDEKNRLAVDCFKNKNEILINDYEKEKENFIDKHLPPKAGDVPQSLIYLPLILKDRTIGVISVQSFQKDAFQEYEVTVLRNIATYAQIAVENTRAYERLAAQTSHLRTANENIRFQKQEIEEKNKELEELNQEKNHLIGIVAHDLRNPLTSAQTMVELLISDKKEISSEHMDYINHMKKALNRMDNMINRILDLRVIEAKKINLDLEETPFHQIIRSVCRQFDERLKMKHLNLSLDLDPVLFHTDPNYLTQILENLISNAIKFSPLNKKISIKLEENQELIRFEIKDEGPGIREDELPKLFGKFQKLSNIPTAGESSTGLGLSIVKKYVEELNGKVWCESAFGIGSCFIINFKK